MRHPSPVTRHASPVTSVACACCSRALAAGLATYGDRVAEVRRTFYAGRVDEASARLEDLAKHYPREADVFKLDLAMVELAAGRPKQSVQACARSATRSTITNSSAWPSRPAPGSPTTPTPPTPARITRRSSFCAMLALADLMAGNGDARAYAYQVSEIQEKIIAAGVDKSGQNPKLAYKRVALGPYIDSMLREATYLDCDDAARSMAKSAVGAGVSLRPGGTRPRRPRPSRPGQRRALRLHAGGTRTEEHNERASQPRLCGRPHRQRHQPAYAPPDIAPVKVAPREVVTANTTRAVHVSVNHQALGPTVPITQVGILAAEQFQAIYPQVIGKAMARRILKKGIVYGARKRPT